MKNVNTMNILFATSEVFPLIKTGGLADVSSGLPNALQILDHDVRIVLPGYPEALKQGGRLTEVATFDVGFKGKILQGRLPKSKLPVWFVDIPELFFRAGGPYMTATAYEWPDNAERFAAFCRVIALAAKDQLGMDWQPELVHCNDWQTGLVPALLSLEASRPATVFTIHNISYAGIFSRAIFDKLKLPSGLWSMDGIEYFGKMSFLKGGVAMADMVTTVSPSYAKEICTPEFGYGFEGLLTHRGDHLVGILNGIDENEWNPAKDKKLVKRYSLRNLAGKLENKRELQCKFGLPQRDNTPLIGMIGRMVEQKGYDLVADALPSILTKDVQVVMLGTGDPKLEQSLGKLAEQHPEQLQVTLGYDESLAHLIEGGADMFMMPSRFEPCGLNQMYSQRYGTVPIVHHTGGLIDSVTNVSPSTIADGSASGFHFHHPDPKSLAQATLSALEIYHHDQETWQQLLKNGMQKDFSWSKSAQNYLALYQKAIESQGVKGVE